MDLVPDMERRECTRYLMVRARDAQAMRRCCIMDASHGLPHGMIGAFLAEDRCYVPARVLG